MNSIKESNGRKKPLIVSITVAGIIMCVGFLIASFAFRTLKNIVQTETQEVLEVIEQNIQRTISESYGASLLLALTVQNDGEVNDFEIVAKDLLEKYQAVDVLQLVPDGVIEYVYPIEGNEAVIGYDILEDPNVNREVMKAAESQSIYFAGPFNLRQGGVAVIGRLPVFVEGELWGFSAVLIYLETLIELSGIESFSDRYHFQLSKNNPNTGEEEFFLPSNEEFPLEYFHSVNFPEGDWKLYATRYNSVNPRRGAFFIIALFLIGAVTVGFMTYKVNMKPIELERLLDKKSAELFVSREQFKQNSELLGSVLESPRRMSIFSLDKSYNYIAFNNNHVQFIKSEFDMDVRAGLNIFSFVPKSEKSKVKARYDRALNGESFEFIRESVSKTGNTMFWQNWYNPIKDKNREIIGITVFSVDISENVKAEQQLEQNEKRYRTLISSSPYCIHELDKEGRLISINEAGLKMFKKENEKEVIGLRYASLLGKKNQPTVNHSVLEALSGNPSEAEISAGNQHFLSSFIPLKNEVGDVIKIMGITQDITERKKAEDFVEASLKEKTTLLSEIHHRVKNNLAIVSGLLELQKAEVNDDYLTSAFDQSINRIISIAMVHELMYETEDLSSVNIHSYLIKLIPAISATMQSKAQSVEFDIDIDEYRININQAIPLGLLLNELITNSFKYAFEGNTGNKISVHLAGVQNNIIVHYADNGRGFNPEIDFGKPKNLGLNLIHAQLQQLDAKHEVVTDSKFQINFTFKAQRQGSHSNIRN